MLPWCQGLSDSGAVSFGICVVFPVIPDNPNSCLPRGRVANMLPGPMKQDLSQSHRISLHTILCARENESHDCIV